MKNSPSMPASPDIPFLRELGVELLGMASGEAQVALRLESRHMNSWQVAHGGVSMTLLNIVMSMAGRSLDPDARGGVTIEKKANKKQPTRKPGDRLIAKGKALHRST